MPQGRKVYCTIFGDVEVRVKRTREEYPILVWDEGDALTRFGLWYSDKPNGECVLFPSKSCRDWNKWAVVLVKDGDLVKLDDGRVVRFDSRTHDYDDIVRFASEEEASEQEKKDASEHVTKAVKPFKPFDRVLVCNNKKERLIPRLFSMQIGDVYYCQDGKCYKFCIPYDGNESAQYYV